MVDEIISFLTGVIIQVIESGGYAGIFFLMLLESCGVLVPSEIIMPFSGFLAAKGELGFWPVVLAGTLGNLVGSSIAYYISKKAGRPAVEKYGRFLLISKSDLNRADNWFLKNGQAAVLIGRLLPVVRTYISFPAGAAKMDLKKFLYYTVVGVILWNIFFTYLGMKLENNWAFIGQKLHNFDLLIILAAVFTAVFYVWRRIKKNNLTGD